MATCITAGLGGRPRTASIRKATKWPPSRIGIGKRLSSPIAVEITRDQRDEVGEALRRRLARDLRDAERPLQVLRADGAGQDAADAVQRLGDDRPGALDPEADRRPAAPGVTVAGQVERRAGDADHHPPLEAAGAVVGVALLRGDLRVERLRRRARPRAGWCGRRRRAPPRAGPRTRRAACRRPSGSRRRPAARRRSPATAARPPAPSAAADRARSARAARRRGRRVTCIGPGAVISSAGGRGPRSSRPRSPFTASSTSPGASGCSTPGSASISPMVGRSVGTPCHSAMPAKTTIVRQEVEDRARQHRQHPPADRGAVEARAPAPRGSCAPAPRDRCGWRRRCRRGT